ncbi:MAG: hypothetical protein LBD58_04805 [Treponema sp.]|nr:hypothetical protein [Treponema sp.]
MDEHTSQIDEVMTIGNLLTIRDYGIKIGEGESTAEVNVRGLPMIRLGSGYRSGLDRTTDQAWIGIPIRLGSGYRSGLDRTTDQAWIGILIES